MASFVGSNHDGDRASKMAKKREEERKEFLAMKEKMKAGGSTGLQDMDDKFAANASFAADIRFKESTVGLSTIEDFKKKRMMVEEAAILQELEKQKIRKKAKKWAEKERKKQRSALTFGDEEDEAEDAEESYGKKKKVSKCPEVDTFFLKDKQREEDERRLRDEFAQEWESQQQAIKEEEIEVTYSYWDGSGHRRSIKVNKGCTIEKFLDKVRRECAETFHELRGVMADQLMYIKEDLIIPHHYTFYDLIVSKARGKSGPLFHFDVHDDVRLRADARVEKDESHAGKIITRSYYDRNQHIFPVNRWEVYDPARSYTEYSIKDRDVEL